MNNRDLIITIARRLDKFDLDEIIAVSELDEQKVKNILSELLKQQIIMKNNGTYFFNIKKTDILSPKNYNADFIEEKIKPIVIEEEEGYDYFLTLNEETQTKIRKYIELMNLLQQTGIKNKKRVIEVFNATSGYRKIPVSSFTRVESKFKKYGFKGILPHYSKCTGNTIPDEVYTCFKKYYLTKEKLSATEAIYKAQIELHREQKIEQPCAYTANSFISRLRNDFTKEQIEYFRNNINPVKSKINNTDISEPLDMLFKNAADIYLKRLKRENKLEILMHHKTSYKNHLKKYFDNLTIREITPKIVATYKQTMFDNGLQLVSVNSYISLLKIIINTVCPQTNNLIKRNGQKKRSIYALDMNILSEEQISALLTLCKKKYPAAYPLLYMTLSTGASIPELLALTWDKINFEENTMFLKNFLYGERIILNSASSTLRTLKINDNIVKLLKSKFNKINPEPTDFIFRFNSPKLPQQYFEKIVLKGITEELGIAKLFPSDLQHNFVNLCLKQNIPLTFIQKSLGHYGITNFVKIYRDLIEKLDKGNYNPLEFLKI